MNRWLAAWGIATLAVGATAAEPVVIIDLRSELDVAAAPLIIPRSLRITPEELERRHHEIPRDRDIVLLCS